MVEKVSTHKDFLERFEKFGFDKGYFQKETISNISKTCCSNSTTEVIDFDKTKEQISQEKNLQHPKSCDALKILPDHNRLDFIEFKGFQQFITHNTSTKKFSKQLKKQVEKFNFPRKITDSLFILENIVQSKAFKISKPEKSFYEQTEKNYIILVDVDLQNNPLQGIAITLATLAQTSTKPEVLIAQELSTSVSKVRGSALHNLNTPILKSCHNIDTYYQSIP